MLRLGVIDTGVGIEPAAHASIFESFVQVDNSYTRSFDGAGLGLSICRELCRALGGELTLESVVGKGSTFTVRLPMDASAALAETISRSLRWSSYVPQYLETVELI